ncbi:MAG: hypothetical protein IPL08_02960 [Saprospiraceae bacterium]|nr:hypothetical protein [Saprospiraceae bacterium]
MNIRIIFTFLLATVITYNGSTQFGLRLKYNQNNFSDWEKAIQNRFNADEKLLSSGYEAGLDYWFRLKKRRIEFMPELAYSYASTSFDNPVIDKINFSSVHFNFNTQIYALDLEGDCNCPTFSKQGPSINKGLFFHFTPGISYYNAEGLTTLTTSESWSDSTSEGWAFKGGVGVGLDLGLSDLLTITPIISYYFNTAMNWQKLDKRVVDNGFAYLDSKSQPKQLQLTIRLGFRPDYGRGGRRRR